MTGFFSPLHENSKCVWCAIFFSARFYQEQRLEQPCHSQEDAAVSKPSKNQTRKHIQASVLDK